jgi:hypothetical protein
MRAFYTSNFTQIKGDNLEIWKLENDKKENGPFFCYTERCIKVE